MVLSMTGFAAQSRAAGKAVLHLELRSINSRYLDLSFRIADDLRQAEPLLREAIAARIVRGKVECRMSYYYAREGSEELAVDAARLAQLARADALVRQALPLAAPLTVGEVLRWPGVVADEALVFEGISAEVTALAEAALDDLIASRQREGEKLAAMIAERVERMRVQVAAAAPLLPAAVADYRERLALRLREAAASLDEERIRLEVGVFAQRVDVAEELSRLTAHLDEVQRVLRAKGPAGKRLDFLMQELNREANTLGSKSVSAELSAVAVELKLLIEQMREQVQNIE